ncbi:MAG: hypothetical protein ACOYEV_19530, partial [Candidatus Nanopelagicales bacterium]
GNRGSGGWVNGGQADGEAAGVRLGSLRQGQAAARGRVRFVAALSVRCPPLRLVGKRPLVGQGDEFGDGGSSGIEQAAGQVEGPVPPW